MPNKEDGDSESSESSRGSGSAVASIKSGSGSAHSSRESSPTASAANVSGRSGSAHSSRASSPAAAASVHSGSAHSSRASSPAGAVSEAGHSGSAHSSRASSPAAAAAGVIRNGDNNNPGSAHSSRASSPAADGASELFGDADDISSGSSSEVELEEKKIVPIKAEANDEDDAMQIDETEEKKDDEAKSDVGVGSDVEMEEVEEPLPETKIAVDIPKITTDLGKAIHFVKLPNFLSVETRPFDPNTYEDEIDDEDALDEEGRTRLKLKVENTIRWRERFNEKGVFVKESNARFVRWSDGSMSLHLGNEIFNVYSQPLQGDHNHLFIRQGTGLQGQAVFRTKLTFRPHSTESFTHRKMTLSLADRSQKTSGIKVLSVVGKNPEANREEMMKREEDKLRASVKRENKQRRVRERASGSRGLSASYLEHDYDDDDDENSISINAIKNKFKKGGNTSKSKSNIYSSDDDDDDEAETFRSRRLEKAKRLKDSDEEDDAGPSSAKAESDTGKESVNSSDSD